MKLKKSKLRKIINEELVRVIMESDVKRFVALKENLDGETDPEGKMAKSQLERSAENAQRLASSMTDDQQLDGWSKLKLQRLLIICNRLLITCKRNHSWKDQCNHLM